MKQFPFIIIILLVLVSPLTILFTNGVGNTASNASEPIQIQYENEVTQARSFQYRPNPWKRGLTAFEVENALKKYNGKAIMSFENFLIRDKIIQEFYKQSITIRYTFKSIPAVKISYTNEHIHLLSSFHSYLKYINPLGVGYYTYPQNIDVDISGAIELGDINRILEIDKIHEKMDSLGTKLYGAGVKIALLDSGINDSNKNLEYRYKTEDKKVVVAESFVPGEDASDYDGHGTEMAAILAGNGWYKKNGEWVESPEDIGIAPAAALYNLKVLNESGYGDDEWIVQGLDRAIELEVDVISASLTSITYPETNDTINELLIEASNKGITIIASSGNYGPTGASIGSPAIWETVIAVGATRNFKELALFTARGPTPSLTSGVDIVAPGQGIGTMNATTFEKTYVIGTSVSVPIVVGCIALLKQAFPETDKNTMEAAFLDTAIDLKESIIGQGNGIINPLEAYNLINNKGELNLFAVIPKRISKENAFYYECVEGTDTTFNIKIISSVNQTLSLTLTGETTYIEFPSDLQIFKGVNTFLLNISLPDFIGIKNILRTLKLTNSEGFEQNIEISIQSRYYGGTILFDKKHQEELENKWFGSSTPYGAHLQLARVLKDRGFKIEVYESGDDLNQLLDRTHVFVISDPEIRMSKDELNATLEFVNDGGSVLFLMNSFRLVYSGDILSDPILYSDNNASRDILDLFDADILFGDRTVNTSKIFEQYDLLTPTYSYTYQNEITSTNKTTFLGLPIEFKNKINQNNNLIGYINYYHKSSQRTYNFPSILSTTINEGRVMMFGSGYPFTDIGLVPDLFEVYAESGGFRGMEQYFRRDYFNLKLVNDTFDWLIETKRPRIDYSLNVEKIFLREEFTLTVNIKKQDNTSYNAQEPIIGTILYQNKTVEKVTFETKGFQEAQYELTTKLASYGNHTLYIPLRLDGHTPTDGRITLKCHVILYEELPMLQDIAIGVSLFILLSIAMFPFIKKRFLH